MAMIARKPFAINLTMFKRASTSDAMQDSNSEI